MIIMKLQLCPCYGCIVISSKNNNVNKADNDNYETKAPSHAMVTQLFLQKINNVNKADNDNYETTSPAHAMVAQLFL